MGRMLPAEKKFYQRPCPGVYRNWSQKVKQKAKSKGFVGHCEDLSFYSLGNREAMEDCDQMGQQLTLPVGGYSAGGGGGGGGGFLDLPVYCS